MCLTRATAECCVSRGRSRITRRARWNRPTWCSAKQFHEPNNPRCHRPHHGGAFRPRLYPCGRSAGSGFRLNRVLYFPGQPASLTSGMPAGMVFGQPDFNSSAGDRVSPDERPSLHRDRYGRSALHSRQRERQDTDLQRRTGCHPRPAGGSRPDDRLESSAGLYVSGVTGEIWVGDAGASAAIRFPAFRSAYSGRRRSERRLRRQWLSARVGGRRVGRHVPRGCRAPRGIYYPGLGPINAANYLSPNVLAPGMITALFTEAYTSSVVSHLKSSTLPLPTQLNGVEVLLNGSPVPLFYADPNQINFQVPMGAPQTGTADLQVFQPSTGRDAWRYDCGDDSVPARFFLPRPVMAVARPPPSSGQVR